MITIVARRIAKPDKVEQFKTLAENLVTASREENGCIEYGLYQDIKQANAFTFIETWRDQAAIDAHNASFHFTTLVPQMGELLEEKVPTNLYTQLY